MAVTNQRLLDELQRLQSRVDELAISIVECSERAVALETWRNGHEKNVHAHLSEQIKASRRVQERQGDRLWKVALQVANLAALLATMTKLAGAW